LGGLRIIGDLQKNMRTFMEAELLEMLWLVVHLRRVKISFRKLLHLDFERGDINKNKHTNIFKKLGHLSQTI